MLVSSAVACEKDSEPKEGTEPVTATQSAKPAEAAKAASGSPAKSEPASGEAASLSVGDPAPAVDLTLQDGKTVALSSLKGKQVALYFYPKDDTRGCTIEAQGIRDEWKSFEQAGVQVYGVSLQDAESHQAFIDKHELPFGLVVDDGSVTKAFGVPVKAEQYAARQTFLIGADGKIKQIWREVDPASHATQLLEAATASAAGGDGAQPGASDPGSKGAAEPG